MEQPPPRLEKITSRQNLPRRMPRHVSPAKEAQEFRALAFENALGNDIGALTNTSPRARFQLSTRALYSLIVLLLVISASLGLSIFLHNPHPVARAGQENSAGTASSAEKSPVASEEIADKDMEIVIYVTGAVNNPGVVTLLGKSRIRDAVEAAGGFNAAANKIAVNLAANVQDGEHLHIPAQGEENTSAIVNGDREGNSASVSLVDINRADKAALEKIPGIGPAMAQNIVEWRKANGAFRRLEDLLNVSGIGEKNFAKIKSYLKI